MVSFLLDSEGSMLGRIRFERTHKTEGDWRPFIACIIEYVEMYANANRL